MSTADKANNNVAPTLNRSPQLTWLKRDARQRYVNKIFGTMIELT